MGTVTCMRELIIGDSDVRQRRYARDNNLQRPVFVSCPYALRGLNLADYRVHILPPLGVAMTAQIDFLRGVGGDAAEYRSARWRDGGWNIEVFTESGEQEFRVEPPAVRHEPPNGWLSQDQWDRIRATSVNHSVSQYSAV